MIALALEVVTCEHEQSWLIDAAMWIAAGVIFALAFMG
jgi:hypothetical protein